MARLSRIHALFTDGLLTILVHSPGSFSLLFSGSACRRSTAVQVTLPRDFGSQTEGFSSRSSPGDLRLCSHPANLPVRGLQVKSKCPEGWEKRSVWRKRNGPGRPARPSFNLCSVSQEVWWGGGALRWP